MKAGRLQTRDYSIIYFNPPGSLCPREQKRIMDRERKLKLEWVINYVRRYAEGRRFVILDSHTKAQLYDTDAQAQRLLHIS